MPQRGNIAVGPIALLTRKAPGPPMRSRPRHDNEIGPEERWGAAVGAPFLYTAANWGAVTWYLEVYMRPTSAKAMARLYNVTAAAPVASSTITSNAADGSTAHSRQRSAALTLVDGNEYRVQYGVETGGAGGALGAKLIAV